MWDSGALRAPGQFWKAGRQLFHGRIPYSGALFVDLSLITGGASTIEFRNDSAADLVWDAYSTDGALDKTWVFAQAFRDYLINGTAESSTISAFVRQFPGRTDPVTAQEIFVLSWVEP